MGAAEWIALILGLPAFLGGVFWLLNKLISSSLLSRILKERDAIINIMAKDQLEYKENLNGLKEQLNNSKEELKELIVEENKSTMKYMGKACDEKLQEYERTNSKIRESRQEMYNQNIDYMKLAIKDISDILKKFSDKLDDVQRNINEIASKSNTNEVEIKHIHKDIEELKKSKAS